MAKHVFICDDDPGIVDSMKIILEDEGYQVSVTDNGADLLQADAVVPDLYLIDIWMSGMHGRDVCQQLKTAEKTKHIPVILISANRDGTNIAQEAGADDFIAKPYELDDLLAVVASHVK